MKYFTIALAAGVVISLGGMVLVRLARSDVKPATSAAAAQANPASAPAFFVVPPVASTYAARTVSWEDLVPKEWDPLKKYRGMNFDALSDADPKAIELLRLLRETWDNAPTNGEMNEQRVRIPGYVVPLDEGKGGLVRFLLVPYFGACIHTPPPPSNQIIDVTPVEAAKFRLMAPVWVTGVLRTSRNETAMGVSSYQMRAEQVEWYTPGLDKGLGMPR